MSGPCGTVVGRARLVCCVGFAVAVVAASAAPAAMATNRLYWTSLTSDTIQFANLDGTGGGGTVDTSPATLAAPVGVAIDASTGKVYTADRRTNSIVFANLSGGGGGDLATGSATVSGPAGVSLDAKAGKIYWANPDANKVSWANLDGSGGGDLFTGAASVNVPTGVAVDPGAGKIYWANTGNNTISFAYLDGSGGGDLFTSGATVSQPEGVAVDPANHNIYWANQSNSNPSLSSISYASVNGTGGANLATGTATVSSPSGVAVEPDSGTIYWGNQTGGQIGSAFVNGSGGSDFNTAGTSSSNSIFPAILEAPSAAAAPVVSGGSTSPTTLSCSAGGWGDDLPQAQLYRAPQSFAYSWTENGSPLSGSSSSITANSIGTYECTVTATNFAGSTSQTSSAVTVGAKPGGPTGSPLTVSGLRVSPHKLSIAGRKVHGRCVKPTNKNTADQLCRRPIKLKVSYMLNVAGTVTLTLKREVPGRKAGGRCVKPTSTNNHKQKCTRLIRVHGKILKTGQPGANNFVWNGKIGGHELIAGTYQFTATPSGGKPELLTFKIVG